MRAYIESDSRYDHKAITVHLGTEIWRVEIKDGLPWLYTQYNEEGDLVINNSALMEDTKWDHISKELLRGADE
jgi:hypothetical protein